jgi:hypothetical protein
MQTFIKPTVISGPQKPQNTKRKPSKILLIVGVIFLILMFVPDPIKFIPFIGEGEELAEAGISFSALAIYAVRYWLYKNIKEQVTGE